MSLGLFVTRWYGGTKNQADVDEMLAFCDQIGVTDIYIHCHEDIAVKDDWDYLGYVVKHRGEKKIFAVLSRSVTVRGKTIRHVLIFDDHPASLRLLLGSDPAPRRQNEFRYAVLTIVLVLAAGLGMFWSLL